MQYIPGDLKPRRTILLCALLALLAGGPAARAATGAGGQLELVSRVDPGAFSSSGSGVGQLPFFAVPSLSQNGRYVAFSSTANNLVPGQVDLNAAGGEGANDVFLYDRVARTTALVSHDADSPATTGDGESRGPVVSADGRWVAFTSQATNLVAGLEDQPPVPPLSLRPRLGRRHPGELLAGARGGGLHRLRRPLRAAQRRRPLRRLHQRRARPRPRPAGGLPPTASSSTTGPRARPSWPAAGSRTPARSTIRSAPTAASSPPTASPRPRSTWGPAASISLTARPAPSPSSARGAIPRSAPTVARSPSSASPPG